jgi:hypothetical protein
MMRFTAGPGLGEWLADTYDPDITGYAPADVAELLKAAFSEPGVITAPVNGRGTLVDGSAELLMTDPDDSREDRFRVLVGVSPDFWLATAVLQAAPEANAADIVAAGLDQANGLLNAFEETTGTGTDWTVLDDPDHAELERRAARVVNEYHADDLTSDAVSHLADLVPDELVPWRSDPDDDPGT